MYKCPKCGYISPNRPVCQACGHNVGELYSEEYPICTPKKSQLDTADKLKMLYAMMYLLTEPECARCRVPHSCCSREYCEIVLEEHPETRECITSHPKLLFMGKYGCVIAPHLRPICTLHTCAINGFGVKPGDEEWTVKYFNLRDAIDYLEFSKVKDDLK